jgi:hypothetical protein
MIDDLATTQVLSVEFVATYVTLHLELATEIRTPDGYRVDPITR